MGLLSCDRRVPSCAGTLGLLAFRLAAAASSTLQSDENMYSAVCLLTKVH